MAPSRRPISQLLQEANSLQQQGQLESANARYREILDRQPRNFEAAYSLGLLTLHMGDANGATLWLKRAANTKPGHAGTHSLLAVAFQLSGQAAPAIEHFRRAAVLEPLHPEHHYNLGKALRSAELFEQAMSSYERALQLRPAYPAALNNLSELLILLENPNAALEKTEEALRLQPDYAEALGNRGGALLAIDRPLEALECLDRALQLNPYMPRALNNRSQALAKLGRAAEALENSALAIARFPQSFDALFAHGCVMSELRRLPEAIDLFGKALKLKPSDSLALVARGSALLHTNQYDAAQFDFEEAIRTAININTAISTAHSNLSNLLLLNGRFKQGWREFEWRWNTTDFKGTKPAFQTPKWDGTPTTGHVLIWREQGIGDQILFASMLQDAALRTGQLTVAVEQRLHPLFKRSFPNLHYVTLEQAAEQDDYDFQAPLGDLGAIVRRSVEDCLAARKRYLIADADRSAQLRSELHNTGHRRVCGLSWSSKHKSVGDRKSISLAELAPLLSVPDYQFIDLQYGDTIIERTQLASATGYQVRRIDSIDNLRDLDGLAALVEACDVIVTISNTTAHLAGALGKHVFLMLPRSVGRFWCWQSERSDSLWYPNVRIFRQAIDGDWTHVLNEVREALSALTPQHTN